jgi:hypothetical protein
MGLGVRYHGKSKQSSAVVESRTGEVVRGKISGPALGE